VCFNTGPDLAETPRRLNCKSAIGGAGFSTLDLFVVWEMEAKLPVVRKHGRRVTARVDETLSSLLVIVITPDPAVLESSNATTNSNGCPYMWQMMHRSSIKCKWPFGMQA
jgi:hypothetical protein